MTEVTDTRSRTGLRPVEHVCNLGVCGPNVVMVHMVHCTVREIRLLADSGTNVITARPFHNPLLGGAVLLTAVARTVQSSQATRHSYC
jgi:cytosine/adenosine deaminase-related metal-dependent hydrolase